MYGKFTCKHELLADIAGIVLLLTVVVFFDIFDFGSI